MQALTHIPEGIRCAADYARLATDFMPAGVHAYVEGGSSSGASAAANRNAYGELAIVPRLLRDVTGGHTRCIMGAEERPHPILLAPVGWQQLYHAEAERASAVAAAATGSGFVASTMSSLTLEDIAATAGPDRWFQLYFQPERAVSADLAARAERAGYRAIVATLDTPIQIPGHAALNAGFIAPDDPPNLRGYARPAPVTVAEGQSMILNGYMRQAPQWADLDWLLGATSLPIWAKGVMHADDARALAARRVAGIIVSNHGGRALDGAPSSLSALPAVRAAVGSDMPVLLDGGIRSGTDIFKAVALGADGVLVGRLQAFALAVAGALGVAHMIRLLREELEACMALAGCATLADVRGAEVVRTEGARQPA